MYDLARFMLKVCDARDRAADARARVSLARARPTVHGVTSAYARVVIDQDLEAIEKALKDLGIDLGAVVEFDEALA